jgi:DNA-binding XRE family transcriptional regulator
MKFSNDTKAQLIECAKAKGVYLEGNILKLIDSSDDDEFDNYIKLATEKDTDSRRKRLEMTKQVQAQNLELTKWKTENEKINEELKTALSTAEIAKEVALADLDLLQKKTQYQLIESIVKVSLWIVCGVGIVTTFMFALTIIYGVDNKIVESAWSNMFGILLTNSFSIIGTIMGVKYAAEKNCK